MEQVTGGDIIGVVLNSEETQGEANSENASVCKAISDARLCEVSQ